MSINIGDNNQISDAVIANKSHVEISNSFQKVFNTPEKIVKHMLNELTINYKAADRNQILADFEEFAKSIADPKRPSISDRIHSSAMKAFSFLGDSSSIAGLAIALMTLNRS